MSRRRWRRRGKSGEADERPLSPRRAMSWNAPSACTCAGIGGLLGWAVSMLSLGGVVSGKIASGAAAHDCFLPAATVAVAVTVVATLLPPRAWRRLLGPRFSSAVMAAATVAAGAATVVLGLRVLQLDFAIAVVGALVGVCLGIMLMQWLLILSDFDSHAIALILVITTLCALCSFVLVHFVSKELDSRVATVGISLAMLAVSMGSFAGVRNLAHPCEESSAQSGTMLARIAAFTFVVAATTQFLLTFSVSYSAANMFSASEMGAMPGSRMYVERVGCLACGIVLCTLLGMLWRAPKHTEFAVLLVYRVIVLTLVMAIAAAIVQLPQLSPPFIAYTLALLAYFLAQVGVWMIVLQCQYLYAADTANCIGYTVMLQFAGYFAGFMLCTGMGNVLIASPQIAAWVLLALLAIVCVAFLFVLTERHVGHIGKTSVFEEGIVDGEMPLDEKCRVVAESHRLTERETEVLKLLARGRNAVSIQEILVISYNTVKVHKHNIYAKLGVHSQQELLTFVEDVDKKG